MPPELINGLFALGGAVVGAIIGGVFSLRAASVNRDRKELSISHSYPSHLLMLDDRVESDIDIIVAGEKVKSIVLSEINFANTGNTTIRDLTVNLSKQIKQMKLE